MKRPAIVFFLIFIACLIFSSVSYERKDNSSNIVIDTESEMKISFVSSQKMDSDSLQVLFYESYFDSKFNFIPKVISGMISKDSISTQFIIKGAKSPGYLTINRVSTVSGEVEETVFDLFLVQPGDSVIIFLNDENDTNQMPFSFYGRGSIKYTVQQALAAIKHDFDKQLIILEEKSTELNPKIYGVLKADILGAKWNSQLRLWGSFLSRNENKDSIFRLIEEMEKGSNVSDSAAFISKGYVHYIVSKYNLFRKYRSFKDEELLSKIVAQYRGSIFLDKILAAYIDVNKLKLNEDLFNMILEKMENQVYIEFVEKAINPLAKGKEAFHFKLPDDKGQYVSFSDFENKVVLLDFWFTGCTGCAFYYDRVLSVAAAHFKENDKVVFINISVDKSKEVWYNSVGSLQNSGDRKNHSSNIINLFTDGKGNNHPIIKYYQVHSYPRPLLIGKNGKIYSSNVDELRIKGVGNLIKTINKAINESL